VSELTYRALGLVAQIEKTTQQEIIERILATYLETRLGAIHEAHHRQERVGGRR
jgi:hypothetical protein